jgi:uncharacterized integral membrane protein
VKKLFTWILLPPVALVVIAFAVANRDAVTVKLDPLPLAFATPLYVVAMVGVFLGLVVGAAAAWTSGAKWRRLAREKRRESERLAAELQKDQAQPRAPAPPRPTAVTSATGTDGA